MTIPVDEADFREDWAAGLTLVELAEVYRVSTATISNWSVRFDCPSRQPGRRPMSYLVDDSPVALTDGEWVRDARGVARWEAST